MQRTPAFHFTFSLLVMLWTQTICHADSSIHTNTPKKDTSEQTFYLKPHEAGEEKHQTDALETGYALPALDIHQGGELALNDNNVIQRPWSSKSLESKGKVQIVQYIAANRGVMKQNKLFNDRLIGKRYSSEQLSTTIIVNMSDTMSLLKGIILKKLAKSKVKHETISFIVDDQGVGLDSWGMKKKSCATIVLDADGKVLFAKNGPLTESEIASTINLIEAHMS